MQLFTLIENWYSRQFWIDYGELFRDWFEQKVRCYKTGNNKEMFNFAPFNTREKNPCNAICCKTGSNVGGKSRNIAIQLVLQQC